jgi:hypothetical protein
LTVDASESARLGCEYPWLSQLKYCHAASTTSFQHQVHRWADFKSSSHAPFRWSRSGDNRMGLYHSGQATRHEERDCGPMRWEDDQGRVTGDYHHGTKFPKLTFTIGELMHRAILLALCLSSVPAIGQNDAPFPEPTQNPNATFRVFRTQNIFTLLKLDTRTGQIWQLQWSIDQNKRFAVPINQTALLPKQVTIFKTGRFTLTPTENVFTFVLLDEEDGRTWQVQWGEDESHRFIEPIPQGSDTCRDFHISIQQFTRVSQIDSDLK